MTNKALKYLEKFQGQVLEKNPSPVSEWLNGRIIKVAEGEAIIEYLVRQEMTNALGVLQGGIIAAIIDDAYGIAIFSLGKDRFYTSVNLSVDYLLSAKPGQLIYAHAYVVREGNTVVNLKCDLNSEDGKLIAHSASNIISKEIDRQYSIYDWLKPDRD